MIKTFPIVMVPTEESRLAFEGNDKHELYYNNFFQRKSKVWNPQELYVVSEDKISDDKFDDELEKGLLFVSSNGLIHVIAKSRVKTIGTYYKLIASSKKELTPECWIAYPHVTSIGEFYNEHKRLPRVSVILDSEHGQHKPECYDDGSLIHLLE